MTGVTFSFLASTYRENRLYFFLGLSCFLPTVFNLLFLCLGSFFLVVDEDVGGNCADVEAFPPASGCL